MCPVGHMYCFYGADERIEDNVIMELEIPDEYCRIQAYYDWVDFWGYIQDDEEYDPSVYYLPEYQAETIEGFGHIILDLNKDGFCCGDREYQVTTEFILKEWVKKIAPMDDYYNDICFYNRIYLESII